MESIRKEGKGIKLTASIAPFWYRRMCEITLLISLIILGLWGVSFLIDPSQPIGGDTLFIPTLPAILAAVTGVYSLITYFWAPERYRRAVALVAYLLLTATTGLLIAQTGEVSSPFVALWMILGLFAGVFGWPGLSLLFVAASSYLAYLMTIGGSPLNREQLIVYFLAGILPILISFVIWHNKNTGDDEKEKAFNALAKQLNQVANKSEIVINAIADGVVAIDGKQAIQLINPAAQKILGWAKEDAMELDYHLVIKLTDSDGNALTPENDPIQQVAQTTHSIVNNNLTLTTNSGKKISISLAVSPVSTTQPAAGVIIVFRDITAEKEEERQQFEFISTASHEMRTPVAAIEGYLGLALNPATATIDAKAQAYLQKAHESAQHLGRLFQDLLDVSKAEDGRMGNNPTAVDIVNLAQDVVASFEPQAKAKGLFLYFKPGDSTSAEGGIARRISPVFYAHIDQDHMREVFNNLTENAIKYTLKGSVTVDIQGDEQEIVISFADTGVGIPPEDVPHLFQKFYRVDNTATREIGGTGLGLYLCRRLVETSNGRIWVESEYGKGSTFFVAIPRISHEKATELIEQAANPEPEPQIPIQKRGEGYLSEPPTQPGVPTPAAPPPAASAPPPTTPHP